MDLLKNSFNKTKVSDAHVKKRGKYSKMPFMGKSVLLARQADVTIMHPVNDSEIISKLVLERFKHFWDSYHQRNWRRQSKYRFSQWEGHYNDIETDVHNEVVEDSDRTFISDDDGRQIQSPPSEEDKMEYDPKKFLLDALGDELNNYPTSNSDTDTQKSNSLKRHFNDDYSIGTTDISTLLSKSNSSYSHFSRKLLRRNTYASSSMYDKDAHENNRKNEDRRATQWINEAATQYQVIAQTSKALNLCLSCKEFESSVEYVEAEKILLLAIEKREAALKELKSMDYEDVSDDCFCLGRINISDVTVPIINRNTSNCFKFWIFVIVSCGPQVYATEVCQVNCESVISFKKVLKFDRLSPDFELKVKLYALKVMNTKRCNNYTSSPNLNRETTLCLTPNKLLGFHRNQNSKRVKQCSSYDRRQPSFALHGSVNIHIAEIRQDSFLLSKIPNYSPVEGSISLKITNYIEFSQYYSAFLTVGSEAGGLATWNLRWCRLSGYLLQCWNYPTDEQFYEPIYSIDLRYCVIARISRVDRELCARPRTLLIETGRLSERSDEESLMMFRKSSYTIIRHYLSAETTEEMKEWERRLNNIICALRNWNCMKYPLKLDR